VVRCAWSVVRGEMDKSKCSRKFELAAYVYLVPTSHVCSPFSLRPLRVSWRGVWAEGRMDE
jgi:hypothetical protein